MAFSFHSNAGQDTRQNEGGDVTAPDNYFIPLNKSMYQMRPINWLLSARADVGLFNSM